RGRVLRLAKGIRFRPENASSNVGQTRLRGAFQNQGSRFARDHSGGPQDVYGGSPTRSVGESYRDRVRRMARHSGPVRFESFAWDADLLRAIVPLGRSKGVRRSKGVMSQLATKRRTGRSTSTVAGL